MVANGVGFIELDALHFGVDLRAVSGFMACAYDLCGLESRGRCFAWYLFMGTRADDGSTSPRGQSIFGR